MKIKVSTTVALDTRRQLKDGSFPLKLRLTFQRKQKYYQLINVAGEPYTYTEKEYQKVINPKAKGEYREAQLSINTLEAKAVKIIEKLPVFTFEGFEKSFLNNTSKEDVFAAFLNKISQLTKEGRAGTADSYNCAYRSIMAFAESKSLAFSSVSPEFLKEYEKWMLGSGKSITTVGIYLRSLRAIYNDAIASGDAHQELYPFGKRKYQTPAGKNIKKALSLEDIGKIFNYKPAHDGEARARDYWVFSYLCNGINVKDIARLKYQNIDKERITFIRAKTERTSRQNLKLIVAVITPQIQEIIDRWGNRPTTSSKYVFPILTEGVTPEEELAKVRNATKTINTYIKRIAGAVGIEKDITTYTARHSFSTVLKRAGAPIGFISEALGHNDMKTTESYLDSFEDHVKRQYSSSLTAFGKSE